MAKGIMYIDGCLLYTSTPVLETQKGIGRYFHTKTGQEGLTPARYFLNCPTRIVMLDFYKQPDSIKHFNVPKIKIKNINI